MNKGLPELFTMLCTVFLGQVLADSMPSKFWAYILLIPSILTIYIVCKYAEIRENSEANQNEATE